MQTKFFHYMVSIIKITQNTMQKAYTFVPIQDFSKDLKDKDLYKKYNLTDKEINIIEEIKIAKKKLFFIKKKSYTKNICVF